MTEDVIECYNKFNTKVCTDKLIYGYFNNQPIPSNYYNFLNDDNDDINNINGTLADNALPENKGLKDAVVPNDEDINDELIIDEYESLASNIEPLQE